MVKSIPLTGRVIVEIPSENQLDLAWSLQPVLYPLRIVGIDLHVGQPRSKFRFFAFLVLKLLVAIFVVSSALCYLTGVMGTSKKIKGSKFWSKVLRSVARLVWIPIFHVVCIPMILFKNWEKLWKKMEKLYHRFLSFDANFASKLRTFSMILTVIILIPDLCFIAIGSSFSGNREKATGLIALVGFQVHGLCVSFLLVLISSLTFLASISIQMITEDVHNHFGPFHSAVSDRVMKWKESYHLILNFVEGVNHLFGPALLTLLFEWSLFFVLYSFQVLLHFYEKRSYIKSVSFLLKIFSSMLVLIIGSENMKNKASVLANKLTKLQMQNKANRPDVNHLIDEIRRNRPIIAPLGMFEVNIAIIPTCIGTTITYFLIMAQFWK